MKFKVGDLVRFKSDVADGPGPDPDISAEWDIRNMVGRIVESHPDNPRGFNLYQVRVGPVEIGVDGIELELADAVTQLGDLAAGDPSEG